MATSRLDIMNRALNNLGAKSITTDPDTTDKNYNIMNAYFSDSLKTVLDQYYWNFATKRADLVIESNPLVWDGLDLDYAYTMPSDMVRVIEYSNNSAVIRIEGQTIYSDIASLGIKYVYNNVTYANYPATFVDALADKLAADAGFMILNSATKSTELLKKYISVSLPRAIEIDNINSRGQTPQTAVTKISIINRALNSIGAEALPSNPQNDKNYLTLSEFFNVSLKSVLSETLWTFATKRIDLTSMTPDDWVSTTTYAIDDRVSYTASTPDAWVTATTYALGDRVTYGGDTYYSLIGSNMGNVPADDSIWADYDEPASGTTTHVSDVGSNLGVPPVVTANWTEYEDPAWNAHTLNYTYVNPSDLIRVLGWSDTAAVMRFEETTIGSTSYQIIRSDYNSLGLIYVYYNTNYTAYPAYFVDALSDKLAADIAMYVTKDAGIAQAMLTKYTSVTLSKATSINAQGQTPQSPKQDAWTNAKYSGELRVGVQEIRYR